jgi:hypothetical protein
VAIRDLAEKGGAQAKENYEKMKATTDEMTGMVEATYATTAKGATACGLKIIEMTRAMPTREGAQRRNPQEGIFAQTGVTFQRGWTSGDQMSDRIAMNASERFLKFADECEFMAKFAPLEDETVWRQMAERWLGIADLFERQNTLTHAGGSMKRQWKPAHSWVH